MNVNNRYEEHNGHRISGNVTLDIDNGEFVANVLRVGGKVNSSFRSIPYETRAEAVAKMESEYADEVAWALAH